MVLRRYIEGGGSSSRSQEGLPDDGDGARYLKVDVFAFGVTLWEMLTRQRPHHNMEGFEIQALPPAGPPGRPCQHLKQRLLA